MPALWLCSLNDLTPIFLFFVATPEPGEDPRVTRAKYFIRDEFLVSRDPSLVLSCSFSQRCELTDLNVGTDLSSSLVFHPGPV